MDYVSDHLQRLKRDHDFVIFDVIADQHQNLIHCHDRAPLSMPLTKSILFGLCRSSANGQDRQPVRERERLRRTDRLS
jgi:hypothetical protein